MVGASIGLAAHKRRLLGSVAVVIPPVATAGGLAIAGYDFTPDNGQTGITDQRFIQFGSTTANQATSPMRLPAVGSDWFQGVFLQVGETLAQQGSADTILTSGPAKTVSNAGAFVLWLDQGNVASTGGRLGLYGSLAGTSANFWTQADTPAVPLERGERYLVVIGQIGSYPLWSCIRCRDGQVMFNVKGSLANDGTSSFYRNSSGVANWNNTSTYRDTFLYAGAAGSVAAGSNRSGFGGALSDVFNVWGTFPNAGGVPDAATLQKIATGEYDLPVWAPAQPGCTLRYHNRLSYGSLVPSAAGAITATATEGGTAASVTPRARIVRRPPALRLDPLGDGFVFGLKAGTATADVTVTGSYSVLSGTVGRIFGRLVKESDGTVLSGFDWQAVTAPVSGGTFTATFPAVPKGTTFRVEVRFENDAGTVFASRERYQVGTVVFAVSQSQLNFLLLATNATNSSTTLAPPSTADRFITAVQRVGNLSDANSNDKSPTNGPKGEIGLRRMTGIGQLGDGGTALGTVLNTTLGAACAIIDSTSPGKDVQAFYLDRSVVNNTPLATGNGSTTGFTLSAAPLGLSGGTAFTALPGSVTLTIGGVTVSDSGSGTLAGTGFTGTINYGTGAITLSPAPANGAVINATWTYCSDYQAGSEINKTTLNQYGLWGVDTGGVLVPHTGVLVDTALRLKGRKVSVVLIYWWTAMLSAFSNVTSEAQYATGAATMTARFDAFKARLSALPGFEDAVYVMATPAREAGSTPTTGNVEPASFSEKYGWYRRWVAEYVASRPRARHGGTYLDITIGANNGPHQDPAGGLVAGERLGFAIAEAMGAGGFTARGPTITSAAFTDGTRQAIDVTFSLRSGTTALRTKDGSTTGILGFAIGNSFATRATTGFTAAITGANTVRITKASGSWSAGASLSYGSENPIFTGTSNGTADNANLQKLLYDDAAPGYSYAFGTMAEPAVNMIVSG